MCGIMFLDFFFVVRGRFFRVAQRGCCVWRGFLLMMLKHAVRSVYLNGAVVLLVPCQVVCDRRDASVLRCYPQVMLSTRLLASIDQTMNSRKPAAHT